MGFCYFYGFMGFMGLKGLRGVFLFGAEVDGDGDAVEVP